MLKHTERFWSAAVGLLSLNWFGVAFAATNEVANLGTVLVEGRALSQYRPRTVASATFTDLAPERVPCTVETLTEDFIRERNPTDLNDLLRQVPGIETGGTSLLVRQPGFYTIRGKGGTQPAIDGVIPVARGGGLFMDPFMLERVEIAKGPMAALTGGQGAGQNANGAGGSINLYLKGATLERDRIAMQENTAVGQRTFRQRALVDVNEVVAEDKAAFRVAGSADYYEPPYVNQGSQDGARGREGYALAPSFVLKPADAVSLGVKTLLQYADTPSYIGVPVWRGKPAGGYGWYESSCTPDDRQTYKSFMINPWLDWQVNEEWLLKFGASMMLTDFAQQTREPYAGKGAELTEFYRTGRWTSGQKYNYTAFSESHGLSRTYNAYARSVWDREFDCGLENSLLVQTDAGYQNAGGFLVAPKTQYGLTVQELPQWGWFTLLGGVRYDYIRLFGAEGESCHAVSPRAGLTIQPLEWLAVFGNYSQTRTPMLGVKGADGEYLTKPWCCQQFEGGVRVRPLEQLWLSLVAYRIEQQDTPVQVGNTPVYEQEGENLSRGAELSLEGQLSENWTVTAMYALNFYTDETKPRGDKGRDFERTPRHTFTLNTSYCFDGGPLDGVTIGGAYRFRSMSYACVRGQYQDENLRFDPSHVVDVNAAIPFSKFGGSDQVFLTLAVRNLLGTRYFDTSRHYYECLVGEPRTFEIGLRAEF